MKKASAKIRRKVKIKFCRELNSMDKKMPVKSIRDVKSVKHDSKRQKDK